MRAKTKNFFEDFLILLVVAIIIYAVYSFFFSSEEEQIQITNSPLIIEKEDKKENEKNIESIVKPLEENLEKDLEESPQEIKIEEEIQTSQTPEVSQTQNEGEVKIEEKTESEKQEIILDEKAKIEKFYQSIREKIYSNIEKNVDKSALKSGEFINIRVTILKDGKIEQLTLTEGKKEYFELTKPSVYKAFPVQINEDIKNNFPRYFRMKIEF
ncbi:hypothetical protein [Arcobacter cloacae]|uniref:TonB C-terminal domain-containing protein n=1 Tax=Arcobacter cloacae TaxID=1054034 RepID=A0A4Q0ZGS2_9BACT|nr:hypothetical protein [Arcobacter cloacae]RXJ85302.1 hypothetical protein CRU90_01615 [Arcobacter cloacae]